MSLEHVENRSAVSRAASALRAVLVAGALVVGVTACDDTDKGPVDRDGESAFEVPVSSERTAERPRGPAAVEAVPVLASGGPDSLPEPIADLQLNIDSVRLIGTNELGTFWVSASGPLTGETQPDICLIAGISQEEETELEYFAAVCEPVDQMQENGISAQLSGAGARGIVYYLLPVDAEGSLVSDSRGNEVNTIELIEREGTQVLVRPLDARDPNERILVPRKGTDLHLPDM